MSGARPDALVVGAGVIGLTTAVTLAEAGLRVEVRAAAPPPATTSAAAGASWGLHFVGPHDLLGRWSARTLEELRRLAEPGPAGVGPASGVHLATGVRLASGVEASRDPTAPPDWVRLLPDARPCASAELPDGYRSGWRYTTPLIDMPVYLDYLTARLRAAGGRLHIAAVVSLAEAAAAASVVVNCTGTGARRLVPDPTVQPVRGQVVIVANPGLTEFFTTDARPPELVYLYPHGDRVLLGGTAQTDDGNLDPDPAVAAAILARCAVLEPRLAGARVIAHRVGLRPGRPAVRLDEEGGPGGSRLIHNYGHGGAGVSLSWGCAQHVRDLLRTS